MRLKSVSIDGFRSVKKPVELFVDPRVTILIGANDHGKTTLLEAIRCLNGERSLTAVDENWDSVGMGKPELKFAFELDPEERKQIRVIGEKFHAKKLQEAQELAIQNAKSESSALVGGSEAPNAVTNLEAVAAVAGVVAAVAGVAAIAAKTATSEIPALPPVPQVVKFYRSALDGVLKLESEPYLDAVPEEASTYLIKSLPRVELFQPVEQIMDAVTLEELQRPEQEFMQGVFRYAGIWEGHETLFRQNPATTRRLEIASADFTRKIHTEWKQGENLEFKFQHAGKNGDQIEMLISDPAVTDRCVRPSERSAGFSAFFTMSMRMLARTEATNANKYLLLCDEPGTSLHPAGQVNLQKVFERFSMRDQIVYATHSLFMSQESRSNA